MLFAPRAARRALLLPLLVVILAAGLVAGRPPAPAGAAVAELDGHDISWPQCPAGSGSYIPGTTYGKGLGNPMPPETTDFVVIGLTDGLPFYRNHCLASQVQWVTSRRLPAGAYTMAAYPTDAQLTTYGTSGPRTGTTLADKLFNTGYAMAKFDLASLKAVGLSVPWVWIDVEYRPGATSTPPNWPTNTTNNKTVLQGIAQGFKDAGLKTGWYSVRSAWGYVDAATGQLHPGITGAWQDKTPMWRAGDYDASLTGYARARSICTTKTYPTLNGGPTYLAQAVYGQYDLDVTCPALPSYATIFRPAPGVSALTASSTWAELGDVALSWTASLTALQDWSAAMVDTCSGATVRSWSGRAAGAVTVTWDGTTSAGAPAPVGLYELRFSSVGITRTATTELATPGSHQLGTCPVTRTYGGDRYRTSVAIGRVAAPSARTVVLASGEPDHLVDGLVAAPVARAAGAPLLLTAASALPSAVHDDLVARGATKAYVVGGTTAVSTAVRNTLTSMGIAVVPVAGVDRYATSVAAAQALRTLGGATDGTAWIGSGEPTHLVDALSAGGPAAAGREPILLTSRTSLPASVAGELKVLGTTKSYVLGSTDTISTTVEQQLPGPVRLGGADRYGTAALVAGTMPKGLQTVISSGLPAHLVDALPGGALGLPILLVSTSVPTATHDRLELSSAPSVHLLGGPDVVNPATARALSDQLR